MTLKKKVLPCKKWITTGQCPYGDRCDYLHPESVKKQIIYDTENEKCLKKKVKKCDLTYDHEDKFFWPPLTGKENFKNENCYHFSSSLLFKDVKSLWIHFEKFVSRVKISKILKDNYKIEEEYTKRTDNILGRRRLDVFVRLGNGEEIK